MLTMSIHEQDDGNRVIKFGGKTYKETTKDIKDQEDQEDSLERRRSIETSTAKKDDLINIPEIKELFDHIGIENINDVRFESETEQTDGEGKKTIIRTIKIETTKDEDIYYNLIFKADQDIDDMSLDSIELFFCHNLQGTTFVIPECVTSTRNAVFSCCNTLTTMTIPSKITNISRMMFFHCKNLESVEISEGVKTIGDNAFEGTKLKSITIPSSVTHIGKEAFKNCESLETITIKGDDVTIDENAFAGCSKLRTINVPNDEVKKRVEQSFKRYEPSSGQLLM